MNKYKEALDNVLKDNPKTKLTTSDIHKDIRLLLKLVNKETPMKVNMNDYKLEESSDEDYFPICIEYYKCPNKKCLFHNKYELTIYNKRCSWCNQLLDWRKKF